MKKVIFTLVFSAMTLFGMAQSPYVYYNFDDNIDDQVGAMNLSCQPHDDATSTSTPVYGTGKVGKAFQFQTDGTSFDILRSPANIINYGETDLETTTVCWFFITDDDYANDGNVIPANINPGVDPADGTTEGLGRNLMLMTKRPGSDGVNRLYYNSYLSNQQVNIPEIPKKKTDDGSHITTFSVGEWHHLAVVTQKNSADATLRDIIVYNDGVEIGRLEGATIDNVWGDITFGNKDEREFFFNGFMDEFAIYKQALTNEQITTIMNGVTTSIYGNIELAQQVNAYAVNGAIQVETALTGTKVVTVYDLSGKPVYTATEDAAVFNTRNLTKGIYIVSVEAGDKSARTKVAVQ